MSLIAQETHCIRTPTYVEIISCSAAFYAGIGLEAV